MCELTVEQLMFHANELSCAHWGVDYTGIIELSNRRWKRLDGKFFGMHGREAEHPPESRIIVMSRKRNTELTDEEVLGVLLHELVHWRLHNTNRPYRDTSSAFIEECLRVGAPISQSSSAQWAYKRYVSAL